MIRPCTNNDIPAMYEIINDAAKAYKGIIPADRWHEPYMPMDELKFELKSGVKFAGFEENGILAGVMGIQDVKDVTLIRHAYVRTAFRNQGIGARLLKYLLEQTQRPVLIGTWKAAQWAIRFYEKHGFRCVSEVEKDKLLKMYWNIPARQVEASVVLVQISLSAV